LGVFGLLSCEFAISPGVDRRIGLIYWSLDEGTEPQFDISDSIADLSGCKQYALDANAYPWLYSARVTVMVGIIAGGVAFFLVLFEVCCLRVWCSRFCESTAYLLAVVCTSLAFLAFGSPYCLDATDVTGGCNLGQGGIYVIASAACFAFANFFMCCSPKPKPLLRKMCCKKKNERDFPENNNNNRRNNSRDEEEDDEDDEEQQPLGTTITTTTTSQKEWVSPTSPQAQPY